MIPISRVCSATRVLIVLEMRTIADSRAKTVMTPRSLAKASVSLFAGQSPGVRTSGRLEKPANPGTISR